LGRYSYAEWRKLRENLRESPDEIAEITVIGGVMNAIDFRGDCYVAVGNSERRVEPPPC
jgi:hypothetical protein